MLIREYLGRASRPEMEYSEEHEHPWANGAEPSLPLDRRLRRPHGGAS